MITALLSTDLPYMCTHRLPIPIEQYSLIQYKHMRVMFLSLSIFTSGSKDCPHQGPVPPPPPPRMNPPLPSLRSTLTNFTLNNNVLSTRSFSKTKFNALIPLNGVGFGLQPHTNIMLRRICIIIGWIRQRTIGYNNLSNTTHLHGT